MCKKIISLFTLTVFIVFTFSCYYKKVGRIETIAPNKMEKLKICEVVKISGEKIKFSKKYPGRIIENAIVAEGFFIGEDDYFSEKRVSIPLSEVKLIKFKKFSIGRTIVLGVGCVAVAFGVLILISYIANPVAFGG